MFTIGQVALLRAAKPPSNLTLLLQTLTAHKFLSGPSAAASQAFGSSQIVLSQQQTDGAAAGVGSAPASQSTQQQQGEGGEQLPAVGAEGVGAGSGGSAGGRLVPACVQAHAWTSLGKVCLVDEELAKKVVPLFVQVSPAPWLM